MGFGAILDGEAAVEELVGLDVGAAEVAMRVVLLGEEAAGPKHDDRQPLLAMDETANLLGRPLADAVNVARLERPELLAQPRRFRRAAGPCRPGSPR